MLREIKKNSVDKTVSIFDNFYETTINVNGADYDIIYSYFLESSNNATVAESFTSFFFRIAQESKIEVKELLESIKNQDNKLQMNKFISFYLNAFKSKSSLYGVSNIPKPNITTQRNVIL